MDSWNLNTQNARNAQNASNSTRYHQIFGHYFEKSVSSIPVSQLPLSPQRELYEANQEV